MRRDILELDSSWSRQSSRSEVDLQDAESIRLLLSGTSVIDWQRLALHTFADVDRFMATLHIDTSDHEDRERLRYVFNEAVSYLEEHLHLRFPPELRGPKDVRQIFVWASEFGGFRRTQILSCVIVKLMHVIHHMEAADLKFRTAVSEEQFLDLAHRRILQSARTMQQNSPRILAFYGSRKSRSSVITKLLAKEEAVAATVFDKLRYRIVVEDHADIVPTLAELTRSVFPFNYVVPGQSHNNVIDPNTLADTLSPEGREAFQDVPIAFFEHQRNEFSGRSYRSINWIVDYPVRVPPEHTADVSFELGRVVFVMVEFQLLDQEIAAANERGENAHDRYKSRQHIKVAKRLKRGAVRED